MIAKLLGRVIFLLRLALGAASVEVKLDAVLCRRLCSNGLALSGFPSYFAAQSDCCLEGRIS